MTFNTLDTEKPHRVTRARRPGFEPGTWSVHTSILKICEWRRSVFILANLVSPLEMCRRHGAAVNGELPPWEGPATRPCRPLLWFRQHRQVTDGYTGGGRRLKRKKKKKQRYGSWGGPCRLRLDAALYSWNTNAT